jgi:hypothetical protein
VKPQQVRCKLDETIEKPCSDVLAHTLEVCEGTPSDQWCLTAKDNHDSWGMCTTSAEYRTIMTAMLMVTGGMDPHTIRITWVGMIGKSGVGQSCTLGRATAVDSVVCSMPHFEEKSF